MRWPGSFGSAFLYYVVPRVILFREEHSPRVLVEKVDFISAPGTSPPGVYRVGGPYALLTGAALFSFEKDKGRFRLESTHPGHTVEEINATTGFSFAAAPQVGATPTPNKETLALLRSRVLDELSETYPQFAELLQADAIGKAA